MPQLSDKQTSLLIAIRQASEDGLITKAMELPSRGAALASALRGLAKRGQVERIGAAWRLTDAGRTTADNARGAHAPRSGTKLAQLATLISTRGGASIGELTSALAWQAHTVRAALSRLRQRGLVVERFSDGDGSSRYRTVAPTS